MADAGFGERSFPDGRVLRLCRDSGSTTIAHIGRELGITRQGAAAIVGTLRDRGYLAVAPSATNGREKTVTLTSHAEAYLEAQRHAARQIEARLRRRLGADGFQALEALLEALDAGPEERLRGYLREKGVDRS